ncbi:hypothetical protein AB0D99_31885 [Streptomyces sp. NPDC047971]|uniref:hypothetical protein n=1 Tax=Streptomyces sp. NPDC047971 TaxID=3154499 RepID=UPI0033E3DF69
MATFPVPDPAGTAYLVQLWGPGGGTPVTVGLPGDPDIATPAVEAVIHDFATALAEAIGGTVTDVARYQTSRTVIEPTP